MSKKVLVITIISCILSQIGTLQLNAQVQLPSEEAYKIADVSKLKSQVEFLADSTCAGRATGSVEINRATFWLKNRFSNIGLTPLGGTFIHHFYTETGPIGRNVIGFIPSSKSFSTNYTIVMAHYDGLTKLNGRFYPGADSNASGVVGLLTLAEMFTTMRKLHMTYDGNIIFVATDGKGLNMTGAENLFYLLKDKYLKDPFTGLNITLDRISLVVNLDQIGSSLSPVNKNREDYLIMLGNSTLRKDYRNIIESCNRQYDTNLHLSFDYYGSPTFTKAFYTGVSEQKFFVEEGIPSVLFTSGITLNNNKPEDMVDTLNWDVYRKRILLIFRWLEVMIPSNQRR